MHLASPDSSFSAVSAASILILIRSMIASIYIPRSSALKLVEIILEFSSLTQNVYQKLAISARLPFHGGNARKPSVFQTRTCVQPFTTLSC